MNSTCHHNKRIDQPIQTKDVNNDSDDYFKHQLGLVTREPVFGVSDQVRHKPDCTVEEEDYKLEILD